MRILWQITIQSKDVRLAEEKQREASIATIAQGLQEAKDDWKKSAAELRHQHDEEVRFQQADLL